MLILIFALQEIFFAIYRRAAGQRYIGLRIASLVDWLGLGAWVFRVYLGA